MTAKTVIAVTVIYSPIARQVREWNVSVDASKTVGELLEATVLKEFGQLDLSSAGVGIWGRIMPLESPLRDGDRVEVYRDLTVDPKVARRTRFKAQGTRGAGLFAKKKVGKEAGY